MTPLIIIIGTAILIWLTALTVLFVRILNSYKKIVKGVGEVNFDLKRSTILDINNKIGSLESQNLLSLQKFGMVRFNPFNETGGDNSFTICLLDGKANGVILTGLHTREKTRMYAKKIENGKSAHELSIEEKKALADALK